MITDKQNTLSEAQAITASAYSTNTIDLGPTGTVPWYGAKPKNDVGGGFPVQVYAQVVTAFAGGTSVQVQVVESDNDDLSSHTVVAETAAIPVAELSAGYQFRLGSLPPGFTKRYLGLRYNVVGTPTAGAISAGLVIDKPTI